MGRAYTPRKKIVKYTPLKTGGKGVTSSKDKTGYSLWNTSGKRLATARTKEDALKKAKNLIKSPSYKESKIHLMKNLGFVETKTRGGKKR
ncbi:MAG: hypothetical protein B7C24_14090 [Bacteroidetes bacterium 4572_77]|nr:MAG: hypothetical protein B7C24_14090 [Bacteroidetes bacterium 4572_77]